MANRLASVAGAWLLALCVSAQPLPRLNLLPRVERAAGQVVIRITPSRGQGSYYLHYRTEGMSGFQVRKMEHEPSGALACRIPTANLYGRDIEYYVAEKRGGNMAEVTLRHTVAGFTQKESPAIYFQDGAAAAAPGRHWEPPVSVNASLSTSRKLDANSENESGQQRYSANGNLRIYRTIARDDTQFDFDANFAHIDPRNHEIEKALNLSSMMVRFKKGAVQFEAGDVAINETEFTTSYLNRRGLRVEISSDRFALNTFYTNSQQKTGFDGFGVPNTDAGIFGAVAGVNLKNTLKLRGMFMTGRDNLDSKTVYASENPCRQGNMFSVWGELNLMKNSLQLNGEFSASRYGAAAEPDLLQRQSDTAWRAGLKYNRGILSLAADYESIGDRFNSIANLFLQNDREGLNASLGLNIRTFSWSVSYLDKKNYMHNPLQDALHQKRAGAALNWGLGKHFRIGADVSRDNLDYDSTTGLQTSSSDMDTYNYSASLGYMAGSTGITISLGKTESVHFTSNLNAALGINLRFGRFLTFSPTLSFQENESLSGGGKSTLYNAYLNSEITIIPAFFTVTITSSYMNAQGAADSSSWMAGCNLNFFASRLFKDKIRPSLSLRSAFQGSRYGGVSTDSSMFHLQADIAF